MPSPCIDCEYGHDDKNTERCANCEKRIKYAQGEFMIPTEGLEADRAAREETRKLTELRTGRPAKKRGPKPKDQKLETKDKQQKADISRYGINIRPTEFCSNIQIQEIMEGVKEIANSQLRSLPQQALWILKQRVEEWKKEHDA